MSPENKLQLECAQLQQSLNAVEDEIKRTAVTLQRVRPLAESQRLKVVANAMSAFEKKQSDDIARVREVCARKREEMDSFLDTFPELNSKEFAGKYEIESMESALAEVYPYDFVVGYKPLKIEEYADEGSAYHTYAWLEQKVNRVNRVSLSSSIFTCLSNVFDSGGYRGLSGSNITMIVVGIFSVLMFWVPYVLLSVYLLLAAVSVSYGVFMGKIFTGLYSVKQFLNDSYDEDIFQQDKSDIMADIEQFLQETEEDYIADIASRVFEEPTDEVNRIIADSDRQCKQLEGVIQQREAQAELLKKRIAEKLEEYDKAVAERKKMAELAVRRYLGTFEWKYEWPEHMFLDVVGDKIKATQWSKGNSLYIADSVDSLHDFAKLVVLQMILHVHPEFASQVIIDYKYMGGGLVPYKKLPTNVCELCTEPEKITSKIASIDIDIRARCTSILQSCESIEEFNKLMESYDSSGESYVILYFWGLANISSELRTFLRNGPKVGYYTKIFLTREEFLNIGVDFPFQDILDYGEVKDLILPRTEGQIRRILESAT